MATEQEHRFHRKTTQAAALPASPPDDHAHGVTALRFRTAVAPARLSEADSAGLDVVRIVACFMVIFLHVAAIGFHDFIPGWWASNVYDSLLRSCVPLFLMITGALLLRKEERLGAFFSRRFSRILPPFLFWSLFYLAWHNGQADQPQYAWYQWPLRILEGPTEHHLWYLYALVGIYAAIPFLRKIYLYATLRERAAFLLLWLAASTWQLFEGNDGQTSELLNVYQFSTFSGLMGYVFFGAVVMDVLQRLQAHRWLFFALFVLSSAVTAVGTYRLSATAGVPDTLLYSNLSPFVMMAALSLFVLLTRLGPALATQANWLKPLGAASLGIYGIHVFVLESLHAWWIDSALLPMPWLSIPVFSVVVFTVSAVIILAVRRVRWLRGMI